MLPSGSDLAYFQSLTICGDSLQPHMGARYLIAAARTTWVGAQQAGIPVTSGASRLACRGILQAHLLIQR